MTQTSYAITGVKTDGATVVQPRQEVNAWANNNPRQLSLFIQALTAFYSMTLDDQLSYFRIAGIHGLPALSWDSDPSPIMANESYAGQYNTTDKTPEFYCPHNSLIFLTWHRVYMLLFEQRLSEIMKQQIIPSLNFSGDAGEKALWTAAAAEWRMPYWDWAADTQVPSIVSQDKISIQMPGANTSPNQVQNPLYKFSTGYIADFKGQTPPALGDQKSFGQFAIFNDGPISQSSGTSRWGWTGGQDIVITAEQAAGIENNDQVANMLQHPDFFLVGNAQYFQGTTLQEQVYRLFLSGSFDNFSQFATTVHGGQGPAGWLSLELIHNCLHDWIGGIGWEKGVGGAKDGYGHMTDLGVAAFDPIFWLHHCNVDRLFAIYQQHNGQGHWWDGRDSNTDPASTDPLFPFHSDQSFTHWNSDNLQDCGKLGYTYDDLNPPPESTNTQGVPPVVSSGDLQKKLTQKYGAQRKIVQLLDSRVEGIENDYILNILYNRYALNGRSYAVHFFLGAEAEIPSDPGAFPLSPIRVGSIHSFSTAYWTRGNDNGVTCANCTKQQEDRTLSKAQVPITLQVLHRALSADEKWTNISHLGKDHVSKWVEENLHWRVVALPGELIPLERLPDLKVLLMAGKAEHPEDAAQPSTYHSFEPVWQATEGKVGGAVRQDALQMIGNHTK